jgi:hypothetical protein
MRAKVVFLLARSYLALTLLVVGTALADDSDHPFSADDLAVLAHLLD